MNISVYSKKLCAMLYSPMTEEEDATKETTLDDYDEEEKENVLPDIRYRLMASAIHARNNGYGYRTWKAAVKDFAAEYGLTSVLQHYRHLVWDRGSIWK